ncbi:MAG: hypothetical protein K0S18_2057 [Anaerocolumna sp.]|nr:hypothetical protein [Anaerocolumna sp.]
METYKEGIKLPGIGQILRDSGFQVLNNCSDGKFQVGKDGVVSILATQIFPMYQVTVYQSI